jgi:hypothetical protein
VSGQLHAPAALPPGKEPLVSIGQEAGWDPDGGDGDDDDDDDESYTFHIVIKSKGMNGT